MNLSLSDAVAHFWPLRLPAVDSLVLLPFGRLTCFPFVEAACPLLCIPSSPPSFLTAEDLLAPPRGHLGGTCDGRLPTSFLPYFF